MKKEVEATILKVLQEHFETYMAPATQAEVIANWPHTKPIFDEKANNCPFCHALLEAQIPDEEIADKLIELLEKFVEEPKREMVEDKPTSNKDTGVTITVKTNG
tara:strand:+ start:661 stop:972 length:312 start_codon:yes stop_codon:yes gene_type:complete